MGAGLTCAAVQADLEEHLADLQASIEKVRRQIQEHLDQHPDLRNQAQLLESIPGIGATTAALLIAEVGDMQQFMAAR